jgi:hypothetical protein
MSSFFCPSVFIYVIQIIQIILSLSKYRFSVFLLSPQFSYLKMPSRLSEPRVGLKVGLNKPWASSLK